VSAGSGEAYLTYSAGADIATPLHQVVEILPFPSVITTTPGADGVLGIVVHREAAVPVLRLAEMLGRTGEPVGLATCLLLVAVGGEIVAFAVDRLRGIEPLSWCDSDYVPLPDTPRNRLLNAARLVQVGTNARMLPELNLTTLALSLRKDAGLTDALRR
jgi:purine-binding chemotaxis protein CheW